MAAEPSAAKEAWLTWGWASPGKEAAAEEASRCGGRNTEKAMPGPPSGLPRMEQPILFLRLWQVTGSVNTYLEISRDSGSRFQTL